jgi:purine-cytosine permease-like protein
MNQATVQPPPAKRDWNWPLWGRWIAANAIAETVGLGSSALLWFAFAFALESQLSVVASAVIVVLGSTLLEGTAVGLVQWWVLRRHLRRAAWWIPANAVAWAPGMVVIFIGVGLVAEGALTATAVLIILFSLALAGAVVGAVHGLVLLWLLNNQPAER